MRAVLQNWDTRVPTEVESGFSSKIGTIPPNSGRLDTLQGFFDKLVRGTNITVSLCILTTWLLHNQIIITKANLTPDHFLTSSKSPKIHSGDFVTSYTKILGKNIII